MSNIVYAYQCIIKYNLYVCNCSSDSYEISSKQVYWYMFFDTIEVYS